MAKTKIYKKKGKQSSSKSAANRRTKIILVILAISAGLFYLYADRRVPIQDQSGVQINWPAGVEPIKMDSIKVAAYNIHRGKGTDGKRDINRIAEVLKGMDFIGLNEVAGPGNFLDCSQAEKLGRLLNMGWQFGPNQKRWYMEYFGNALLSRLDINEWKNVMLKSTSTNGGGFRSMFITKIEVAGKSIPVLITHLDLFEDRKNQFEDVMEVFKPLPTGILMGDLNTYPDDPVIQNLFNDPNYTDAIAVTLGDRDVNRRDWIITKGMEVLEGGMFPIGVSDHPCFWVKLKPIE